MVEAAPAAAFIMSEPELLFEFLMVALDAPAQLGQIDQAVEGDVGWNGGEPVLGRRALAPGPGSPRPTTAPCRRNAAAIGAAPESVPAPSPPPSARRSRARPAAAAPGNSPSAARPGPRDRSLAQAPRHRPQNAILGPHSPGDPSQPPLLMNESPPYQIHQHQSHPIYGLRLSDSARLGTSFRGAMAVNHHGSIRNWLQTPWMCIADGWRRPCRFLVSGGRYQV